MATLWKHNIRQEEDKKLFICQARSQKFAMGGGCFGGLGAKPSAAGGWGFWGKAPSRRRHGGLGAEPPALKNFAFFFAKITSFKSYFDKKIMLLKRGLEIGSANKIKRVA